MEVVDILEEVGERRRPRYQVALTGVDIVEIEKRVAHWRQYFPRIRIRQPKDELGRIIENRPKVVAFSATDEQVREAQDLLDTYLTKMRSIELRPNTILSSKGVSVNI